MNGLAFYKQYLENIRSNITNLELSEINSNNFLYILKRESEIENLFYIDSVFEKSGLDLSFLKDRDILKDEIKVRSKLMDACANSDDLGSASDEDVKEVNEFTNDLLNNFFNEEDSVLEKIQALFGDTDEVSEEMLPMSNEEYYTTDELIERNKDTLMDLFGTLNKVNEQCKGKSLKDVLTQPQDKKEDKKEPEIEKNLENEKEETETDTETVEAVEAEETVDTMTTVDTEGVEEKEDDFVEGDSSNLESDYDEMADKDFSDFMNDDLNESQSNLPDDISFDDNLGDFDSKLPDDIPMDDDFNSFDSKLPDDISMNDNLGDFDSKLPDDFTDEDLEVIKKKITDLENDLEEDSDSTEDTLNEASNYLFTGGPSKKDLSVDELKRLYHKKEKIFEHSDISDSDDKFAKLLLGLGVNLMTMPENASKLFKGLKKGSQKMKNMMVVEDEEDE